MSLQLLTRRNPTCNELLCTVYNLNSVDLDLFYQLASGKTASLDELALSVKRDRSTVHRSLQKLVGSGLCYKEVKSLKEGGYYHAYGATDISVIRKHAEQRVKEIVTSLGKMLDNFESDVRKHSRS